MNIDELARLREELRSMVMTSMDRLRENLETIQEQKQAELGREIGRIANGERPTKD